MKPIFGEFECKVDTKGRFLFPAGLLRQFPEEDRKEFVLNRSLDGQPYLILYPLRVFEQELAKIYARNQFVLENRNFARLFQSGASAVALDGSNRVLIPKRLMEAASLSSDLVLVGMGDKIEIWNHEKYHSWVSAEAQNMPSLSEKVMGHQPDNLPLNH